RLSATMRLSALLREPLLAEPRALQRRIVRLWLENGLGSLRRIGFDHVEAVLELACDGPPNGRVALPGACEVVRCYEALTIEKRRVRQPSVAYSYRFQAGSELIVAEAAMKLSSSVVARDDVITKNALEAFFDADKLPRTMTVRNFRP